MGMKNIRVVLEALWRKEATVMTFEVVGSSHAPSAFFFPLRVGMGGRRKVFPKIIVQQ